MISAGPSNARADMSSQSSPFPATHSIQGNMGYKQVEGIEIKPMEPTVEMPPMEMKLHYGKVRDFLLQSDMSIISVPANVDVSGSNIMRDY